MDKVLYLHAFYLQSCRYDHQPLQTIGTNCTVLRSHHYAIGLGVGVLLPQCPNFTCLHSACGRSNEKQSTDIYIRFYGWTRLFPSRHNANVVTLRLAPQVVKYGLLQLDLIVINDERMSEEGYRELVSSVKTTKCPVLKLEHFFLSKGKLLAFRSECQKQNIQVGFQRVATPL